MIKFTTPALLLFLIFISFSQLHAQTGTCDGVLPFEEQNGLITIEMESGILPAGTNWQTGSEPDPNLPGSTINYIFWDGPQSFSSLTGAPITYNIKINNPGTYRLAWRGRIGTGTSGGEHNDAWLRIVADDFYATRTNNATSTDVVEPAPTCNSNPDRNCPEGSSVGGYFKGFMNRHPVNLPEDERWGFVTNTNDGSAYRFIWATFNTAGNYSVIVDARSSFFFMDKMVLRRTDVSNATAYNLTNSESSCATLSVENPSVASLVKVYPNPTRNQVIISNLPNQGNIVLKNMQGVTLREIKHTTTQQTLDMSTLQSGVYFISNTDRQNQFVKKIVKL